MNAMEAHTALIQIATGLDIPVDSPVLVDRILDRIGNLRHQAQHAQVLSHCLEKNKALHAYNAELQATLHRMPQSPSYSLTAHPLYHIFNTCIQRSLQEEQDKTGHFPFWTQPWVELAETYGAGFLYAQAIQRLREAQCLVAHEGAARKRLDAINRIAMGLLHERRKCPPSEAA